MLSTRSEGAGLIEGFKLGFEIPEPQKPSEWAADHFIISADGAAEPGRWSPDRAAYQPGMLDVFVEDDIREVVFMTSAQVGKTTTFLIIIGYTADRTPAPMLFVMPTLELVEGFSKERLDPAIRDCPRLTRIFPEPRSRDGDNTVRRKQFPGGFIALAGANSPTSLRMRAVKLVLADEVDAYPASVGEEGDPIELARKRTQTFYNSKLLASSTPKHKVTSKVSRLFDESDKRYFFVPCPACGHEQKLEWKCKQNGEPPTNIKWDKGKPETAYYICSSGNGCALDDNDLKLAVRRGHWKKTATSRGIAGFFLWELYSPWSSLVSIVERFERAVGFTDRMQTFWNTILGLPWEGEVVGTVDAKTLYGRREKYDGAKMPARAALLTAAVDVQHDRLEVMIIAWGLNDERWILSKMVLLGDPNGPKVWENCEEVLLQRYPHPSGRMFPIEAAALDTGGHHTQKVYDFCVRNILAGRLWWPIKGQAGQGRPMWHRSETSIRHGVRLFIVGVDGGKAAVYSALAIKDPGPNYVHIPDSFQIDNLERMTVEKCMVTLDKKGFPELQWKLPDGAANEELDLMVYNLAARHSLNVDIAGRLDALSRPPASAEAKAVDARALARRLNKKNG